MKRKKGNYQLIGTNWSWEQLPARHYFSKEIYDKFGIEILSLFVGEKLVLGKNLFIGD